MMMEHIKENYSNTHTESSHDGKITNSLFEEAKKIILKFCNTSNKTHSLISVGTGCTGAIELI